VIVIQVGRRKRQALRGSALGILTSRSGEPRVTAWR
jgi:hypothetical protein